MLLFGNGLVAQSKKRLALNYKYRLHFLVKLGIFIIVILGIALGGIQHQEIPQNSSRFNLGRIPTIQDNTLKAIVAPYFLETRVLGMMITTAYNPVPEQTDSTPTIMASGKTVYEGAVACPSWIELGTTLEIDGEIYTCEDRTHPKNDGVIDIMMFSKEEAIKYGRRLKEITLYD